MSRFTTDTFNTGAVAAGASASFHRAIPTNRANIGKWKVTPDASVIGWVLELFKRTAMAPADRMYATRDPVLGTKTDPSDRNGNEVLEGWILPYEDLDLGKQVHIRITNRDAVPRSYDISIYYEPVNGDRLDDNGNEVLKFGSVPLAVNEITVTNAVAGKYPFFQASGADADIGIQMRMKGNGGLQLMDPPVGSDIPGSASIDLQGAKADVPAVLPIFDGLLAIHQVPSGSGAICGGLYNKASSVVSGVLSGLGNIAAGLYSHITGGAYNNVSGAYSAIVGGSGNRAPGDITFIGGGIYAKADKKYQRAYSGGCISVPYDAQVSELQAKALTVDATPTVLKLFTKSTLTQFPVVINPSEIWSFQLTVLAVQAGMANVKKFVRQGIIKNVAGVTTISAIDVIGTDLTIGAPGAWAIATTADDVNDALKITVTGVAATSIKWLAKIELVEIEY